MNRTLRRPFSIPLHLLRMLLAFLRWFWRYGLALSIFALLFIALVPRSTLLVNSLWQRVAFDVSAQQFDFLSWELDALRAKADQVLYGQHALLSEEQRSQFVRDYMADLQRAQALEAEIAAIYSDPTQAQPAQASAGLQGERDALRDSLRQRQSTTEAILEGQVAAVLVEQGFGVLGQLLPPMAMRFSRVPNLLVTSPLDEIRLDISLPLVPLPVDERAAIEQALEAQYELSALVVPLGGIALYPAMVFETASIPFAVETFAHEWLHHYLYFYPLGLSYFAGDGFGGEARIINETTADLFGKEIAGLVLARYYPDFPPPVLPTYEDEPAPAPDPQAFDFGAAMHETRVTLDELLAEGDVEGAEAYLEERRLFFYENGIALRRLNQAFFAFYGGYQAGGGVVGAGGSDPTGPAIVAIRAHSPTVLAFIEHLRGITTRAELLALQDRLISAPCVESGVCP